MPPLLPPPQPPLPTAPPLASLGLVADVQYADIDDGASFDGSERRCYRRALEHAAAAGAAFRAARCRAALQVGDAIDGHNASAAKFGADGAAGPQGRAALAAVLARLCGSGGAEGAAPSPLPLFHCVGNHELLNFSRAELELRALLPLPLAGADADADLAVAVPASAARDARLYSSARPRSL